MKKLLKSLLSLALACTVLTGCAGYELNGRGDTTYNVTIQGALLAAYAKSLAYGEAASLATYSLFEEDADACAILELLMENAPALTGGHLLINGYVLTKYVKE